MNNNNRGFFEIGIYQPKYQKNIGTLYRSAYQLGATGIFSIGKAANFCVDTTKSYRHIPYRHYTDFDEFIYLLPKESILIAIEMEGKELNYFSHPQQAIYLLGSENMGLPEDVVERCHCVVSIESIRTNSYNVAVAGSIVMYHRLINYKKNC